MGPDQRVDPTSVITMNYPALTPENQGHCTYRSTGCPDATYTFDTPTQFTAGVGSGLGRRNGTYPPAPTRPPPRAHLVLNTARGLTNSRPTTRGSGAQVALEPRGDGDPYC